MKHIKNNNEKFEKYFELLVEYNSKYNLTSIVDRADVYKKHFEDSLLGMELIPMGSHIIDIGCGAGFPSIPLCIVRNDIKASLYDSVMKKVNFCNIVINELGLNIIQDSDTSQAEQSRAKVGHSGVDNIPSLGDRIQAIHSRVEDIPFREHFDICVARAVARLNTLSEYALPYLKVGGSLLAYKSNDIAEELQETEKILPLLGAEISQVATRHLDHDTSRKIVIIKKVAVTDKKYPRGKNLPRTKPLV